MKVKVIILTAFVALFSFTVASTKSHKEHKELTKKNVATETRMNQGLAMEDKNQFN